MNSHAAFDRQGRFRVSARRIATFATIGAASTLAYVAIYAWLRLGWPAIGANALALLVTAIANTAANRRFTFEVKGRRGLARDHAAGLMAVAVALAITTSSVGVMNVLAPHAGRLLEIAVLVSANAAATIVRFMLLRMAIERESSHVAPTRATATLQNLERIPR
jgi:putative flippase GtrA